MGTYICFMILLSTVFCWVNQCESGVTPKACLLNSYGSNYVVRVMKPGHKMSRKRHWPTDDIFIRLRIICILHIAYVKKKYS
jgi:hypothetical protein